MKREWKPGDVARIHYGEFDDVAIRFDPRDWAVPAGTVRDQSVEVAYPLVVIDPEDREQVASLSQALARYGHEGIAGVDIAYALRSLITPPKPTEPGRYGVVIAGDGREWMRYTTSELARRDWCRPDGSGDTKYATWDDLDVIRVVREGVTP